MENQGIYVILYIDPYRKPEEQRAAADPRRTDSDRTHTGKVVTAMTNLRTASPSVGEDHMPGRDPRVVFDVVICRVCCVFKLKP